MSRGAYKKNIDYGIKAKQANFIEHGKMPVTNYKCNGGY